MKGEQADRGENLTEKTTFSLMCTAPIVSTLSDLPLFVFLLMIYIQSYITKIAMTRIFKIYLETFKQTICNNFES